MSPQVFLGLSGGVDSAVAAALLLKQGYDVTGVFMRNWDSAVNDDILGNPNDPNDICPQEKDYRDACKVAEQLGIKILRVDFIQEYWDRVFAYFLDSYQKGYTPNPDILCNKEIKFKAYLDYALEKGADYIATGHYARLVKDDRIHLYRALDSNKDQTYFLCQLNAGQLEKTLFPVGDYDKPAVRAMASQLNLAVAQKKDSTGICFIGERNFREFLKNYLPARPGDMVDIATGQIVGKHEGYMYYTIGQRHGLGIGGEGEAWFVVGKNVADNLLYVAQGKDNPWLWSDACLVEDINWINPVPKQFHCTAKFRYRQKDNGVTVQCQDDKTAYVSFDQPVKAVTIGQAAVFYQGAECLGGGTIIKAYFDGKERSYL